MPALVEERSETRSVGQLLEVFKRENLLVLPLFMLLLMSCGVLLSYSTVIC